MIYLGQDVSVLNEPSLLLSLEFSAHTVRIIARPTTIICLRSKSNKTNPKNRDTVLDCLGGGIYSVIESGTKSLCKNSPDCFFPFSIKILLRCLQNPGQLPHVSGKAQQTQRYLAGTQKFMRKVDSVAHLSIVKVD